MYLDEEEYTVALPTLRDELWALIKVVDVKTPILMSNEHFVLSQPSTKIDGKKITPSTTFPRLARLFSGHDIRIMLCLRRQDDLAQALYAEHYARPENKALAHLGDLSNFVGLVTDKGSLVSKGFDFDEVMLGIDVHFPGSRMCVWLFEEFCEDNETVLRRLLHFMEIADFPVNKKMHLPNLNAKTKRPAPPSPRIKKLIKALLPASIYKLLKKISWTRTLAERLMRSRDRLVLTVLERAVIRNTWRHSNARVAERNPDLAGLMEKYGYQTSVVSDDV